MIGISVLNAGLGMTADTTAAEQQDLVLVDAIRRGAPGSREALYNRYKRRVHTLALRIVGTTDAEEVMQEAFIRIFRGIEKFRGDSALGTWIYRLAVNAALSHRSRRPQVRDAELTQAENVAAESEPAPDAALRRQLERALMALPAGYRAVVVLHDIEGLEHEEVSAVLGCHVGTSKSQLHKARARLRELLLAEGITAQELLRTP